MFYLGYAGSYLLRRVSSQKHTIPGFRLFTTMTSSESTLLSSLWRSIGPLCGTYLLYWGFSLWIEYRRKCEQLKDLPGYRTWFSLGSPATLFIGKLVPGQKGRMLQVTERRAFYETNGCDVYSAISILPSVDHKYSVSDPKVIKQICANRTLFIKPIHFYKVLLFFGQNIIAAEGALWKKYRKMSAPAFSVRNNRLVWDESITLVHDMITAKHDWKGRDIVDTDNPLSFTVPIALNVISGAGFGRQMRFSSPSIKSSGHSMTFSESLEIVSENVFVRAAVPDWVPDVAWKRLGEVRVAFSELRAYMKDMIHQRRTTGGQEERRFDLLSGLLDSNEEDGEGDLLLDDEEIIGNVFIFLIAGHETTAHTLAYTFGLLAFFQHEQDLLYQQIKEVCPTGQPPVYDDIPKLTRCLAVFNETLRMFPSVPAVPKITTQDTTIVVDTTEDGKTGTRTIPIPKGSDIFVHIIGAHYNPRYWKDPTKFDPSRFLDPNWPRDAFLPFSMGHRSCIGRSFAETEAIAIITTIILQYKVEIQDSFMQDTKAMTDEERFEKLFDTRNMVTLTPAKIPLRFSRR